MLQDSIHDVSINNTYEPSYSRNNIVLQNGVLKKGETPVKIERKTPTNRITTNEYGHQGFCKDSDGNFYFVNTNIIHKVDPTNSTTLLSNHPASVLQGNHYGSPTFYKGYLYVPYETYNGHSDHYDYQIIKINPSDLTLVRSWTLPSDFSTEISGLAIDNEFFYCSSYEHQKIQVFSFLGSSDHLLPLGNIDMDYIPKYVQAICVLNGYLCLHSSRSLYFFKLINPLKIRLVKIITSDISENGTEGLWWEEMGNIQAHTDIGGSVTVIDTIEVGDLWGDSSLPELTDINGNNGLNGGFAIPIGSIGQIYMKINIPSLYDFVSLFDTPEHNTYTELWVYGSGQVAGRLGKTTTKSISGVSAISEGVESNVILKWSSNAFGIVSFVLIVDGMQFNSVDSDQSTMSLIGIGGMHNDNTLGTFDLKSFGYYEDDIDHSIEVF